MPEEIPVDLVATRGRLVPPGGLPQPPRTRPPQAEPQAQTPAPSGPEPTPPNPEQPRPRSQNADHDHAAETFCRFCEWPQSLDPVEPTRDDVVGFTRAVVAGELFAGDVDLFDGSVRVTYRVLSSDESEAVRAAVLSEVAAGKLRTERETLARANDLRLGLAVSRLSVGPSAKAYDRPADPYSEDLGARYARLMKDAGSEPVFEAVRQRHAKFHGMVTVLLFRALNQSFSKATASSGASAAPPSSAA